MLEKNIKVSEVVHDELYIRKRKDESFDDVLKRALGLFPLDVEDLTAFYPGQQTYVVKQLIDLIEQQADFETAVAEEDDYFTLNFDHPESRHTIVQARFHEDRNVGMRVFYRDNHGKLATLVEAYVPEDEWIKEHLTGVENPEELEDDYRHYPVYVGPTVHGSDEDWETAISAKEDLEPRFHNKIRSSYERWG